MFILNGIKLFETHLKWTKLANFGLGFFIRRTGQYIMM